MNKKILLGLSCTVLCAGVAVGCNSKSKKDTPAYHLFASTQRNKMSYQGYYDEDNNWHEGGDYFGVAGYATDDVITCTKKEGSVVEYGKDLDLVITAKPFCLLGNYTKYDESAEGLDAILNPYSNSEGYAVPYIGYGNPINKYNYPLSHDYYTYTREADAEGATYHKQVFHLHIDGAAFQKNIVIDFGGNQGASNFDEITIDYDSYDEAYETAKSIKSSANFPTLVTIDSYDESFVPVSGEDRYYMKDHSYDYSIIGKDRLTTSIKLANYNSNDDIELNKNFDCTNLYTLANLTKDNFDIINNEDGTAIDKNFYELEITTDGQRADFVIPYNRLYDLDETSPTYYQPKYASGLSIKCNAAPNKIVDIKSTISNGTKIDEGYGCSVGYVAGTYGTNASTGCDSIFDNLTRSSKGKVQAAQVKSINRNYRVTFNYTQAEPESETITWPNVEIESTNKNSYVDKVKFSGKEIKTDWRKEGFDSIKADSGENELVYKMSDDGKFVLVCANPAGRTKTYKYDNTSGNYSFEDLNNAGKHNLFMVFDYYGLGSYFYKDTAEYCKSVNFIVK